MRLAGFIPGYRCAPQIARVIAELDSGTVARFEKIFVVDNASPDGTFESARRAIQARADRDAFELIRWPENQGLGGSFKRIFSLARASGMTHLLLLHGDDQADGRDIPSLIERSGPLAAVLGSRFARGARRTGYSRFRFFGNWAFNLLFSVLLRRRITDIGSGLNLYRVDAFPEEFIRALPTHIAFDTRILFHLHRKNLKFAFVPIAWKTADESSTVRNWQAGGLALKEASRFALGIRDA